ncbi:PAS domain-containing protein [Mesorhizobium sp. CAU 1732]|uniref:PAS domain-containing protein n=1 Tax=Mesorhizobium sp. CAU 1732 TaxID=3140358 RepID=UPI0032613E95
MAYRLGNGRTPIGLWMWAVEQDTVYGDATLARYFGLEPQVVADGISINAYLSAIHPGDYARAKDAINVAASTGGRFHEHYRVRTSGNEWREIVASGHCFKAPGGKPLYFPGWIVDLNEISDGRSEKLNQMRLLVKKARSWATDPAQGYVLDDVVAELDTVIRNN